MQQSFKDLDFFRDDRLISKVAYSLLLLIMSSQVLAFTEARLQYLSRSGQTALFNIGIHEGIKEGEYGVVLKEINDLETRKLRMVPVARVRNVKINPDSSVWILYRRFDSGLLVKGDKFLILTESALLEGRKNPRIGRATVVGGKGNATKATLDSLKEDKDRLSKLKDEYGEEETFHEKEYRSDDDIKLLDVDEWRESGKTRYRTAIYKSPHANDFTREHRLATFEKMVVSYLRRMNDPDFNYDEFYDAQMKTSYANEFKKHSSLDTEYENFLYNESRKKTSEAKVYRSILEKGRAWSENFTDDELRGVLKEVSVLQEKERRDYVVADPRQYALFLDYGLMLTDRQTDRDTNYRRSGLRTLEGELEVVPFIQKSDLERFTLHATVRQSQSAFSTDDFNVSIDDLSMSLGLNWYPMHAPYVIQSPMIFVGTYVRSGYSTLKAPTVNEQGNYTSLVAPGFRGGLRYNFRNGVGMRFTGSVETMQLEHYGKSKQNPALPDRYSLTEGKMSFAVAYSF